MNASNTRTLFLLVLILSSAGVLLGVVGKAQGWRMADALLMGGLLGELLAGGGFLYLAWKQRGPQR